MNRSSNKTYLVGLAVFLVACVASFYIAAFFIKSPGKGHLTAIHEKDPELQNAIATARQGLPDFRKQLAKQDPNIKSMAIKARLPASVEGAEPEYVYVDHLKANGDDFSGILADQPVMAKNYHKGDPITVRDADVVDWVILYKDDTHDGGYTDAVLSKRQSK